MSRRAAPLLAAALSALLGTALPGAAQEGPPDVPAGEGRIVVRVVEGATGEPMPGVPVLLYALTAGSVPGMRRAETGPDGTWAFEGVATRPEVAWLTGARHRELPFPGSRVEFVPGETEATAEIRISALDPDPGRLEHGTATLRLARDAGGLRVVETISLHNPSDATYYVPAPDRPGGRPAVATELAEGASRFEMPLGVVPEGIVRDGRSLRYFGPVYPGPHELGFAYVVPPEQSGEGGERFRLELAPPAGASELVVLLPEGLGQLSGARPHPGGPTELDGRRYQRFLVGAGDEALHLELPPARIDPDAVRIARASLRLTADDAALDVTEDFLLEVAGRTQVLGTAEAPLAHIELPDGARDVRFGTDAAGVSLAPHPDGGLAAFGTLGIGESWISVGYRLPVVGGEATLERRFGVEIPLLSIFVADDGELEPRTGRLHRRRPMRTSDRTYIHLEAFEVEPDETVDLVLRRLPARTRLSPGVGSGIALLAGLAVIAFVVMPLWNERGLRLRPEDEGSETSREREAVYTALEDLDHDFETGKLSAEDHAGMREELRRRAVALLRAERDEKPRADGETDGLDGALDQGLGGALDDGLDGETDEGPRAGAAPTCPACDARVAASHRFCPQCGSALDEAAG